MSQKKSMGSGGVKASQNQSGAVKARFSTEEKAKIRTMTWMQLVDTYVGQAVMLDILSGRDTAATRRGQGTLDELRDVLGAAAWRKVRHAPQMLAMVVSSPKRRGTRG